ncbi:MAG: DNA-3-methyladenine glycosylase family protein, partial [Gemmatimonadales bacterium]
SFGRVGLSEAKAIAIKRVAHAKIDGLFDRLKGKTDEQIRELLVAIKGIGPWTVDMVLMFGLARRDVWPIGDGGIQRAAREQYAVAPGPELDELGDRFRPYRSYAAWYLWRSLE